MKLTKDKIAALFEALATRLLKEGTEGEIGVVGGAAMVIAYDARNSTKDVDAIFKPSEIIRKAARALAAEHDLPENWLNDAVKGFMPRNPERKIEIFSAQGLRVWIPEPEYLLAMKSISARVDTHDADDLRILMKNLNLKTVEDVFQIVEKYYPDRQIPPKMGFFLRELLQEPTGSDEPVQELVRPGQWRPCSPGWHWRKAHFQASYRTKAGKLVRRHRVSEGCCENPSKKDQIYPEELKLIAKKFCNLKGPPASDNLGFKRGGNKYDELIRGWTQFWNDTLEPTDPLDPNLIKALIATESGFNPSPSGTHSAKGLMQITNASRKSLGGFRDELKDHLIHIEQKEILDPIFNIAAGTRWIFQKKHLAEVRLKRKVSWDEAVAEYKDYLRDMTKKPDYEPKAMKDFRAFYEKLAAQ